MKLFNILLVFLPVVHCLGIDILRSTSRPEATLQETSFLYNVAKRQGQRCGASEGGGTCEKGYCCSKQGWVSLSSACFAQGTL